MRPRKIECGDCFGTEDDDEDDDGSRTMYLIRFLLPNLVPHHLLLLLLLLNSLSVSFDTYPGGGGGGANTKGKVPNHCCRETRIGRFENERASEHHFSILSLSDTQGIEEKCSLKAHQISATSCLPQLVDRNPHVRRLFFGEETTRLLMAKKQDFA
jgi:hypothetical protein